MKARQVWKHFATITHSVCLQPTPIIVDQDVVRIFGGYVEDPKNMRGQVGYIDYHLRKNLIVGENYTVLKPGDNGHFDSFGAVPTFIIRNPREWYLLYAGYQQLKDVRFCVFTGLAIGDGKTFRRAFSTPVMDRIPEESLFRVIHCALPTKGGFHVWYCGGSEFIEGETKTVPSYTVKYMFVEKIYKQAFDQDGKSVLEHKRGEVRIGRPWVLVTPPYYHMWYCHGGETYRIGYAIGLTPSRFHRYDNIIQLQHKSEMYAYPAVVPWKDKLLMFYNTKYGKTLVEDPAIHIAELDMEDE